MRYLVTGATGHLGAALVQPLAQAGHDVVSIDINAGPTTSAVGNIADRTFIDQQMQGVDVVIHPATLHKPHVVTHSKQDFVDTNISGTLNLLEAAVANQVKSFVFTSTTSAYGYALRPTPSEPAVWVTEDTQPIPKNIYGITKLAAENLCKLIHDKDGLPVIILRTSRFFPEEDDNPEIRHRHPDGNVKLNEYLHRRVELEDVVSAHLLAANKAPQIGFGKYIVSATSPFQVADLDALRRDPDAVVAQYYPEYQEIYGKLGWHMFSDIDRVYVNQKAREELGWQPKHDFGSMLTAIANGADPRSPLAQEIGSKGYHDQTFTDGPYPVE
ncbi:MAG: NAD-dependent epimerase/dehydratase family protein [Pseudomonadales bacterium]